MCFCFFTMSFTMLPPHQLQWIFPQTARYQEWSNPARPVGTASHGGIQVSVFNRALLQTRKHEQAMMWTIILYCNFKINGLPEIRSRLNSWSIWTKARAWPLKSPLALAYPCADPFLGNPAFAGLKEDLAKPVWHPLTPHLHPDDTF